MTRVCLALGLAAIGLFGFDAWTMWFMDHNPAAREFFASRAFTAALFIGGLIAIFVCTIVVAALLIPPAAPAGRTEPEADA